MEIDLTELKWEIDLTELKRRRTEKESTTKSIFRAKLLRHIKHEVFKTLEDDTYD